MPFQSKVYWGVEPATPPLGPRSCYKQHCTLPGEERKPRLAEVDAASAVPKQPEKQTAQGWEGPPWAPSTSLCLSPPKARPGGWRVWMHLRVLERGHLTPAKTVWQGFEKQPRSRCGDVTHQSCHPDSTVAGNCRGHLGWALLKATT